ncbi:MAG: hypothetical protein JWQ35_2412 [Bacteriovoracaceae bacterium]|nr:hypothetical protein [Bacteriovoracaceae bacterium]
MSADQEPKALPYIEGALLIVFVFLGAFFTFPYLTEKTKPVFIIPGLIEAENLQVRGKSPNLFFQIQPTKDFPNGSWTKDSHMFGMADRMDDWIEFSLPISQAGKARLNVYLTRSNDYGIIQFLLNGKKIGAPVDLWTPDSVTDTGKITLGEFDLPAGTSILRIEVTGKNPKNESPHYFFGMDGLVIEKI